MDKRLADLIDDALHLARAFKNGFVQGETIEARRAWARDAAEALDLLALQLSAASTKFGMTEQVEQYRIRNEQRRRAEAGEIFEVRPTFRYICFKK